MEAFGTDPGEFHHMTLGFEAELRKDGSLSLLNFRVAEFDDPAALAAAQMVMVGVPCQMLIGPCTFVITGFSGQPGFCNEMDSPEHCCLTNAGIYLSGLAQQSIGAQMAFRFQKGSQDGLARPCHPQPSGAQVGFEARKFIMQGGLPSV